MRDVFTQVEHRIFRAVERGLLGEEQLLEEQRERYEQWLEWKGKTDSNVCST